MEDLFNEPGLMAFLFLDIAVITAMILVWRWQRESAHGYLYLAGAVLPGIGIVLTGVILHLPGITDEVPLWETVVVLAWVMLFLGGPFIALFLMQVLARDLAPVYAWAHVLWTMIRIFWVLVGIGAAVYLVMTIRVMNQSG